MLRRFGTNTIVMLFSCFLFWGTPTFADENKPNVLFIAVDDLRPELNCYGSEKIHSPNIDRLASTGVLFQRAYCQQAVCNPSRTSLMTGMRPNATGITGNHAHFRSHIPDVVTLPQHFKNHGYHAQAIGKIYHGLFPEGSSNTHWDTMGDPESWSVPATRFGPQYYYTEEGIEAAKEAFQKIYQPTNPGPDDWKQKLVFGPATESPDVSDDTLYDGQVAKAAIKVLGELKQKPDQPFFLAVGFIKPHSPYIAPKKYFDLYDDVDIADNLSLPRGAPKFAGHRSGELRRYTDQPAKGKISAEKQRRVRHAYFACVSYIDAQIGRVLGELDRLGLSDNTIVVLYGDHGYHLGEQGLWGKTTNFELDTRVPLIVRSPGMKAAGKTSTSMVELVDLYPTLAQLAGLPSLGQLEGTSFAKLLDNPLAKTKQFALSQYPRAGGLMGYSMRTDTHRLTQWIHQPSGKLRATELYAYHPSSPFLESENVAFNADQQSTVTRLSKQLTQAFGLKPFSNDATTLPNRKKDVVSFENAKQGKLSSFDSRLGTWSTIEGHSLIDDQHAKTGTQCLQLAGSKSMVQLEIATGIDTTGTLSFWAERWTRRDPFSFRIEKLSNGDWSEIYNGDDLIKTGRSFLNRVKVRLNDPNIKRLRFSVTSPPNTGILIDDVDFSPTEPQQITDVKIVPLMIPALVGSRASPLLKLRIDTVGDVNPISLTELVGTLAGTTDFTDIESVQVLYSGSKSTFDATSASKNVFGKTIATADPMKFTGKQTLLEGENYFWITCHLKTDANIDHRVGATCSAITFSDGTTIQLQERPSIQRMGVAVRNAGDDGAHTFRIPGLATTNEGTLIGVYDVRQRTGGDLPGDIDVGMSRSTDGGRTWEPMKIILDMGDDPNFRFDGIGDPTVLVDRGTGTIWCAATWSHGNRSWFGSGPGLKPEQTGQFMLTKSDDDGLTWSEPINITEQVKKPEWSFLLQGPGKGMTMHDGTIVFPAQYQDPPNANDKTANRLPHSTFIYSRDHGTTWQAATGAYDDTTEAQVVELANGEIMINCRYNRQSKRVVMTTTDLGETWSEHTTNRRALIEPSACMASLINVGRELGNEETNWLLFSNPNSLRGRNHITIKASPDLGKTWPEEHQLLLDEQTGAGYSCLTMIDPDTIGILYEGSQAQMTFQRIKLADVLNPPPDQKTTNPALTLTTPLTGRPRSELSIARVFGDHMVLQSDQPIRIWGTANPNTTVVVALGNQTKTTDAANDGTWQIELAAEKQNATPQSITIRNEDKSISIIDVLIGEVWFCAGQSNMEWSLVKTTLGDSAIRHSYDPLLRLLNFPGSAKGSSGEYTATQFASLIPEKFSKGNWSIASPASSPQISGVGYYFARELREQLNCPVGIINVALGGTPIESWIAADRLLDHPTLKNMVNGNWLDNPELDLWCQGRARANLKQGMAGHFEMPGDEYGPHHSFKPGFMHSASVGRFQPMSIRGVLWYQGESNADNRRRINQYELAFPLMVQSWRKEFQNPDLAWVFVQLPAMGRPQWPLFREQQRRSLSQLDNVGMAITIDTGNSTNVHPQTKQPVGERLAAWALNRVYGKQVTPSGPLFRKALSGDGRFEIEFDEVADGLKTSDGQQPNHFEIAGSDGKFQPANATIQSSNTILLSSPLVPHPINARYAWKPFPQPIVNLINSAGIPASPFTSEEEY